MYVCMDEDIVLKGEKNNMVLMLFNCPLCGAPARAWEWNGGARVDCSKWSGKDGAEHFVGVGAKTMDEAVKKWNTRPFTVNMIQNGGNGLQVGHIDTLTIE